MGNLWDHIEHRTTARELQETIRKNKKYYRAYRNYMSENEIGTVFSQMAESVATEGVTGGDHAADKGIQGLGANNGKVTGVARVIRDFSEIDRGYFKSLAMSTDACSHCLCHLTLKFRA